MRLFSMRKRRARGSKPALRFPRPSAPDQLEGRNLVRVGLERSGRVREVWLDERARENDKLLELIALTREREVPLRRVPR